MKIVSLLLLPLLCLSLQTAQAQSVVPTFSVQNGYIYQPLKGSTATAGYGTIKNNSDHDLQIKLISADGFKAVELHETISANEMMKMQKIESLTLPKGGSFELKPGGNHIMLFDPTKQLNVGDKVPVTFQNGTEKSSFVFEIRSRTEQSPMHKHK